MKNFILLLFIFLPTLAIAQNEEILDFHSNISINADGSMIVEENILVYANGLQIKHGIYRDFPTDYWDKNHNHYRVAFEIQNVSRDGKAEAYHQQRLSNGVRIYIGQKNIFIPTGSYRYKIIYKTNRQLGFFSDHDELFWNVTGNGWNFPIRKASASIKLPFTVNKNDLRLDGYTGVFGSLKKNLTASLTLNDTPYFETTKALDQFEGLSILLIFPKGLIKEPTQKDRLLWLIQDNQGGILAIFSAILLAAYYFAIWAIVGRDPETGTIIPLYEAPKGFTPEELRYIVKMGYDNKVFTTAIINLAVNGFLKINEATKLFSKAFSLQLTEPENNSKELSELESDFFNTLISKNRTILELEQKNYEKIQKAGKILKDNMDGNYKGKYFIKNTKYFALGILLSFLAIPICLLREPFGLSDDLILASIFLSIVSFLFSFLFVEIFNSYKTNNTSLIKFVGVCLGCTIFEIIPIYIFLQVGSALFLISIITCCILHAFFYYLLKAPTIEGRKLLDQIDGFKLYLGVAENDTIKAIKPEDESFDLYEKYLPYALAFDLENAWTKKFQAAFEKANLEGRQYVPVWYGGSDFNSFSPSGFSSSIGSSLTSAISSSSSAPGSSGGGGGGSGGGGGGGGGGGW